MYIYKNIYIKFLLSICCVLLLNTLFAQNYRIQSYNIGQGLPQTQVNSICQDNLGHIWAATLGGLARFDGLNFSSFTEQNGLTGNASFRVIADKRGDIWTSCEQGLMRFNGKKFNSIDFGSQTQHKIPNSLYCDFKGQIWVGFRQNGVHLISENQTIHYDSSNGFTNATVLNISSEKNNIDKIWLATWKEGLWCHQNGRFRQFAYPNKDILVEKILFTSSHQPLLITPKGLLAFDANEKLQFYPFPKDLPEVNTAIFLPSGDLWLGTKIGLFRYDFKKNATKITDNEDLNEASISEIISDSEGNIWIATDGQGLFKATSSAVRVLANNKQLKSAVVMTICQDKSQKLWCGTYNSGLYYALNNEYKALNLASKAITCSYVEDSGKLWFGSDDKGIFIVDNQKIKNITSENSGLPSNRIYAFAKDENGVVWISTKKGICQYKDNKFTTLNDERFTNISVSSLLHLGKDSMLFSCNSGLYLIHNQRVTSFLSSEIIGKKASLCMNKDKAQNVWFGTLGNGLFCWQQKSNKVLQFTTQNGLASDMIYSVLSDDKGVIWVGSGRGFHRLVLQNDYKIDLKVFGKNEAIEGLESNQNAIFNANGKMLFGTTKGVYEINPEHIYENNMAPQLALKSVRLFYDEKEILKYGKDTSLCYSIPYNLILPASQNHLTFDFIGISHTQPEGVRYKYMIEGLDKDWSPLTEKNSATYSEIPSGKYVFKVIACNSDGVWTKEALTYAFQIQTPFYKTIWFQCLALIGLVGFGAAIQAIRGRMKLQRKQLIDRLRIEEQNKIRQKTSEDFHDELGNKLTRISILTDIIETKLDKQNSDLQSLIVQIRSNTKDLYLGTKDILWSLRPESDNLYGTLQRMTDFGVELFSETDIEFQFSNLDESMKNMHLQMDYSRNLQMICKEALNNILRHAKAKTVLLNINLYNSKVLIINIKDDGIGFNPTPNKKGNGLQNMRLRAERIEATFNIKTEPNQGTSINIELTL